MSNRETRVCTCTVEDSVRKIDPGCEVHAAAAKHREELAARKASPEGRAELERERALADQREFAVAAAAQAAREAFDEEHGFGTVTDAEGTVLTSSDVETVAADDVGTAEGELGL